MPIDYDELWMPGAVRIRASAPDPYAGLTGHAYIKARGLGITHVERIDAFDKAATVQRLDAPQRAEQAQLVSANLIVNLGLIDPTRPRRFYMVPAPKRVSSR